jgi:drug/metabolite transporter (DMT)-like permease
MKKEHTAILQMLVCGLMWSTGGLLIKLLPWNALVIAGYRSVLTAGVIALYMRMRKLRFVRSRQSYSIAAAMTAVILTFLPATKLTTAANAIVLQYTAPVYVLLFSAVFRKQRMRRGDVLIADLLGSGADLIATRSVGKA